MRIPNIICENTFKTYELKQQNSETLRRKLKSDNFSWDDKFVKTLKFSCLETIKNNWKDYPLYNDLKYVIDRQILSEILSCELPLSLTVPIIDDNFYWKRRYKYFWPQVPRPLMYIKDIEQFYHSTLPSVDKDGIRDKMKGYDELINNENKLDVKENDSDDKAHVLDDKDFFFENNPTTSSLNKNGSKFFKKVNKLIKTVNNLNSLAIKEEKINNNNEIDLNNNGHSSNNRSNSSLKHSIKSSLSVNSSNQTSPKSSKMARNSPNSTKVSPKLSKPSISSKSPKTSPNSPKSPKPSSNSPKLSKSSQNSPKPSLKLSRSPKTSKKSSENPSQLSSKQDSKNSIKMESSSTSRKNSMSEVPRKLSLPSRKASATEMDDGKKIGTHEDDIEGHFMEVPLVKSWKICYLEKHFQEILQDLEPIQFNQEVIRELIDLIGDYIYSLKVKSLKAAVPSDELPLQSNDHIPLDMIIGSLPNLFELNICFNEMGLGDNFTWDKTSVSDRDCKLLGQGLEKSDLKIFRIIKSNINAIKLELFLKPLLKNMNLKILDLSHCIIGDDGVEVIVSGLKQYSGIESLILVNNKIGVQGAEYLAGYLKELRTKHGLVNLNIKLNEIKDEGCNHLADALMNGGCTLKSICLAGCGLEGKSDRFIDMLNVNNVLEKIDFSNNKLGMEYAYMVIDVISKNKSIIHFDLRMCNIGTELRAKIDSILCGNWAKRRGQISRPVVIFEMPYSML